MILPCGVQTSNKVIAHDPIRGRLRQVPAGAGTAGGEQSPVSVRASIHSSHSHHEFRLFRGAITPRRDENSRTRTTPDFQLISPGFTWFQLVSPNFTSGPQGGSIHFGCGCCAGPFAPFSEKSTETTFHEHFTFQSSHFQPRSNKPNQTKSKYFFPCTLLSTIQSGNPWRRREYPPSARARNYRVRNPQSAIRNPQFPNPTLDTLRPAP